MVGVEMLMTGPSYVGGRLNLLPQRNIWLVNVFKSMCLQEKMISYCIPLITFLLYSITWESLMVSIVGDCEHASFWMLMNVHLLLLVLLL